MLGLVFVTKGTSCRLAADGEAMEIMEQSLKTTIILIKMWLNYTFIKIKMSSEYTFIKIIWLSCEIFVFLQRKSKKRK